MTRNEERGLGLSCSLFGFPFGRWFQTKVDIVDWRVEKQLRLVHAWDVQVVYPFSGQAR